MIRKQIVSLILLLFLISCQDKVDATYNPIPQAMATYYIDPSGNNSNNGSIGSPWATLAWASTHTTAGDIIHVNAGTYATLTSRVTIPSGVSIEGAGSATTIFNSSLAGLPTLYIPSGGNQHISGISIIGTDPNSSYAGIVINCGNVKVYNCIVRNFNYYGVRFAASSYVTGNEIYGCTITGCGFFRAGEEGCLSIGYQDGLLIHDNSMTADGFSGNHGDVVKGVDGYIKNMKLYNNTMSSIEVVGVTAWDFVIEIWNWEGGNEIYNNTFIGSIDVVGASKGSSTYSVWIHDNVIGQTNLLNSEGIRGVFMEYWADDLIIERNYIHHVALPIAYNTGASGYYNMSNCQFNNNTIRYNVLDNIGATISQKGWGIYFDEGPGSGVVNNFKCYNNTIKANTSYTTGWGISIPDCGTSNGTLIANNIVYGFGGACVRANPWGNSSGTASTINTCTIQNNIYYNNGNNVTYWSTGVSHPGSIDNNNSIANPPFTNVVTGNYHLTADRPGMFIVSGLTDRDGIPVTGTPTIGAYQFVSGSVVLPTISSPTISSITSTTAIGNGNVTSAGGGTVSTRGICWSTSASPTISNSFGASGNGIGTYSVNLTGLVAGTTYYVRAYATNEAGTVYSAGTGTTFVTLAAPTIPVLITTTISSITTTTASSGGYITSDGGAGVTARGVCWSTSLNPTVANSKTTDGTGAGIFTSSITGLTQATVYHVRAYATNSVGTAYGSDISFTTSSPAPVVPTLTTITITNITQITAISGGNISTDGGASVTSRGVCWALTSNPTISSSKTSDGTGTGIFASSLTGLLANTTYHVRSYATNSAGTGYGSDVTFTTAVASISPTITTTAISSITQTTAVSGGNVTSDGGSAVSVRGVCWSTTINPTTANSKTTDGTGAGIFASSITGLLANTTYHVRAYATNGIGTSYGSDVSFTTTATPVAPIVTTTAASAITMTTATSGGNVTSTGGLTVTARGICWSTTINPTIGNSHTTDGTGAGIFTSSITGLTQSTTYYIRAYATNSVGTAYGSELTFTTLSPTPTRPTMGVTSVISSLTPTTATSGGNVISDGGSTLLYTGICISTTVNPPTTAGTTIDSVNANIGQYVVDLTGLTPNTTYYIRSYAENSIGTTYASNTVIFTTPNAIVSSISIAGTGGATTIITDNGTLQMLATVLPVNASNKTVTWSVVSGGAYGAINSVTGVLTAISNGSVVVRATATDGSGVYGNATITMSNQLIPVTGITVSGTGGATTISTNAGTLQMLSSILPVDATNQSVTWSRVNGTGTANISGTGLLTAITDGSVTVRATAQDGSGVYDDQIITISNQVILVSNIQVSGTGYVTTITTLGGTLQMVATVTPGNATDGSVTWSRINGSGTANISGTGLLTALTDGIVTVRATANDASGIFDDQIITISNQVVAPIPVSSITVTGAGGATTISVDNGTLQMSASVLPANATDKTFVWSIVNGTGIAEITPDGLLKAVTNGDVTVKAISNN